MYTGLPGDVHSVGRVAILQRVVEADDLRRHLREHSPEHRLVRSVRRVVGPQREDSPRGKVIGEAAQPGGLVERGMAGMQQVPR